VNKYLRAITAVVAVVLTGCANTYGVFLRNVQGSASVYAPEVGQEGGAEVGEGLVHVLTRSTQNMIKLTKAIDAEFGGGRKVRIPSGATLDQISNDPRGTFFVYYGAYIEGDPGHLPGVFFPDGSAADAKLCSYASGNPGLFRCDVVHPMLRNEDFDVDGKTRASVSRAVRQEFIYQGGSEREVKFLYREYTDSSLARPAFSQALTFDISKDKVVGFQGLRLEVLTASNTRITYKVLAQWQLIGH
jgi:hypothetical protein